MISLIVKRALVDPGNYRVHFAVGKLRLQIRHADVSRCMRDAASQVAVGCPGSQVGITFQQYPTAPGAATIAVALVTIVLKYGGDISGIFYARGIATTGT